jgi:hypothetical protein
VAVIVATVILTFWPRQRITAANFCTIQIGMSQTELRGLLGDPEFDFVGLGVVEGPDIYVTNSILPEEQLRQRGFQDCRYQQWTSSEITISVISNQQGEVVCRWSSKGRPWEWREFLRSFKFW